MCSGALQRIGAKPPPAVIVSAQDILVAVRASIALGAVLPELRDETRALAKDLAELAQLRHEITAERDGLKRDLAELGGEHADLSALVEARQASLAADEVALGEAGKRAATLADRAKACVISLRASTPTSRRAKNEPPRSARPLRRLLCRHRIASRRRA